MKLSVTIIALNEEKNLARAINSVQSLADEVVVVVDPRSRDKTLEVARSLGAKTFVRVFDNFANQKNFASQMAKGKWILAMDADEEIPTSLKDEIKKTIAKDGFDGYLIPRRNILFGKEIKHTRWSPDKHIWLWKKNKGKWAGKIHEEVILDGKPGELKEAKIHHSYETVSDFISMLNSYSQYEAEEKIAKGQRFSFFRFFFDPCLSFFRRFIYKKGFLDGWRGFTLSYLMAIYRLTAWIKVWEKQE